jgi:hypothetical protein
MGLHGQPGMVAHTCNCSTQEPRQEVLEFQAKLGHYQGEARILEAMGDLSSLGFQVAWKGCAGDRGTLWVSLGWAGSGPGVEGGGLGLHFHTGHKQVSPSLWGEFLRPQIEYLILPPLPLPRYLELFLLILILSPLPLFKDGPWP